MGHAAHFLRRLDRVSDGQVELALTLYRDEELLREVLARAELPDGAERLAISLADPVEGPFVVVTRAGRFVTCLGEGMRASELPVVTRERLDAAAARVTRMREQLDRVRALRESGAEGQAALAFKRMQQQGPRFAREDAETLLRAQPLVERHCLELLTGLHLSAREHVARVAAYRLDTPKKLRPTQADYLLALADAVWSLAHLIVLVGSTTLLRAMRQHDQTGPDRPSVAYALANRVCDWGTSLHVMRSLWFLARGGKRALASLKAHDACETIVDRLFRELGLGAIALRSEKLRAEALKAITASPFTAAEEDDWHTVVDKTGGLVGTFVQRVVEDPAPAEAAFLDMSRKWAARFVFDVPDGQMPTDEQASTIPDEVARLAWLTNNISLHDVRGFQMHTFAVWALPTIVRAAPEELFLRAEWAKKIVAPRSVHEAAYVIGSYAHMKMLDPVRKTRRSEGGKIGRNDPCACGSGKKHKRCCGAA